MTIPLGIPSLLSSLDSKVERSRVDISSAVNLCIAWSSRALAVYSMVSKPCRRERERGREGG
jgi:hypothetical protein